MLSDANFLILDEPTNHLDITSKEILENALCSYTGTVLFVSHDRYFINRTATRILELAGGTLIRYLGNYDYYMEKRIQTPAGGGEKPAGTPEQATKEDWQQQKARQAKIRKLENDLKRTEERIASLEDEIAKIDEECARPDIATNSAKLGALAEKQEKYRAELQTCYETWEELSLALED